MGQEEEEEEEMSEEEREKLWAELEVEIADAFHHPVLGDGELGLDGLGFEDPDDASWDGFEDLDRWMDDE